MPSFQAPSQPLESLSRRTMLRLASAGALLSGSAFAGAPLAHSADTGEHSTVVPLLTQFIYEAFVTIAPAIEIGPTPDGIRRYIPITGGTFTGPRLRGTVLPGGADWQLQRSDGVLEVNALYSIKTDDGTVLTVQNTGVLSDSGRYFRTVPSFKAPIGPHDWLNKNIFVGSALGAAHPGAVIIRVFQVL